MMESDVSAAIRARTMRNFEDEEEDDCEHEPEQRAGTTFNRTLHPAASDKSVAHCRLSLILRLMRNALLALSSLVLAAASGHADLYSYVAKAEPEAGWSVASKTEVGTCEVVSIKLKSQVWEGIAWEHDLVLFRPKDSDVQDKMFLLNSGGKM